MFINMNIFNVFDPKNYLKHKFSYVGFVVICGSKLLQKMVINLCFKFTRIWYFF